MLMNTVNIDKLNQSQNQKPSPKWLSIKIAVANNNPPIKIDIKVPFKISAKNVFLVVLLKPNFSSIMNVE